jgi:hypothetical protein
MGWLQQWKKRRKEHEFLQLEYQMREHLRAMHSPGIARWCFTCKWFVMREEKPHNRVCRCPADQLHFQGNECLGWKLDPNFRKRKASVVA